MARGALERLLDADRLNALFERTVRKQYTRELLFSTLIELMSARASVRVVPAAVRAAAVDHLA